MEPLSPTAAALSIAAVLSLAADPGCGGAAPGSELAHRLAAIATHESGRHPFAIGVNADPGRGLPARRVLAGTRDEAVAAAAGLLAAGRGVDLGLMQISHRNLGRHGLSVEAAFDPCRSMRAGARHFADDVRAVWGLAHRRYNCGGSGCGAAYAAGVERALPRIARARAAEPAAAPAPPVSPPSNARRPALAYGRTVAGRALTYAP